MLIEREKAELREIERQREEDERFRQGVVDKAKAVGNATVAAGSVAVNATVATSTAAATLAAESARKADVAIRTAASEVAQVANTLGDMAGNVVIQRLAPGDLLGT